MDPHPSILTVAQAAGLIGAADVVLDPRLAADETAYILEDAGVRVAFVDHRLETTVGVIHDRLSHVRVVVVGGPEDEFDQLIHAGEPLDLQPGVSPHDPCLVLYSSGTSGRPKGVVLTQHNMLTHTRNAGRAIAYDDLGVILLSAVMFHSWTLVAAAAGMPGVIVPDLDPPSLIAALRAGMTHAMLTPAAIVRLQHTDPSSMHLFRGLRTVLYGAAPMPEPTLRAAMRAWPETRFFEVYGMTELVGVATMLDDAAHRDSDHPGRLRSAGRPIPGVEMRVVDPATGQDVTVGDPGELWFRTEQSTPGYLGEPGATQALVDRDGWVRTGDIGRVDDDGYVFIEDRMKDVILVNGYNVYSAEVERVLAEHPGVLESAVIGVPDEHRGEAVKAVVVTHPEHTVGADELVSFVRGRIASHKAPASVDLVPSLPRNALGKVLKRPLRQPHWAALERQI